MNQHFRFALLLIGLASALVAKDLPVAPRAMTYPLDARRDGRPFEPEPLLRWCSQVGINVLVATVCEGPAADDARALLPAAAAAGLPVVLRPLPGDAVTVRALARALGDQRPAGWAVPGDSPEAARAVRASQREAKVIGTTTGPMPGDDFDIAWFTPNGLLQQGLSLGDWATGVADLRAAWGDGLWATVSCLPPDWFIEEGCLPSRAEQRDLFATAHLRPATVEKLAGENLLLPEPAQIRLQTYAALGSGANGVVFDGPGHLMGYGPEPLTNHDRAAAVVQLCRELALFEPFLADTEPPVVRRWPGADVGVRAVGNRRLALAWRSRRSDSCVVGGGLVTDLTLDAPSPADAPAGVPERVDLVAAGGLQPMPVDQRDEGTRLPFRVLDVTAAVAMGPNSGQHAAWLAASGEALGRELPAAAVRLRTLAMSHLAKVVSIIERLPRVAAGTDGADAMRAARSLIDEAGQALSQGYARSAVDLAQEAERMVRTVATVEWEAACEAQREADPRSLLTLATLPYAERPLVYPATEPPALPLEADVATLADGAMPRGWRALGGFDQTVATLRGDAGTLLWTPAGDDPGVLALPFAPAAGLRAELELELAAAPRGARMVLLAPGPGRAPLGGIVVRPDGTLAGWPERGQTGVWRPGERFVVALALRGGRLTCGLGNALIGAPRTVKSEVGALLLAKPAGDDPVALRIRRISIRPEGE